jgi:hypothetical protein
MESFARLVWLDRSAAAVTLDRSIRLTIGRDAANQLCLAQEPGLSRHHAELRPGAAGEWLVCDLGSSNGTYVEGERLSGCRLLAPGDRIRLGRRGPWLQFLPGEPAAAPSAPGDASPPLALAPIPVSDGAPASQFRPAATRPAATRAGAPPTPVPPAPASAARSTAVGDTSPTSLRGTRSSTAAAARSAYACAADAMPGTCDRRRAADNVRISDNVQTNDPRETTCVRQHPAAGMQQTTVVQQTVRSAHGDG